LGVGWLTAGGAAGVGAEGAAGAEAAGAEAPVVEPALDGAAGVALSVALWWGGRRREAGSVRAWVEMVDRVGTANRSVFRFWSALASLVSTAGICA
jgi:hypothetical protein